MSEHEHSSGMRQVDDDEGARRLSSLLLGITRAEGRERISIGDLLHALHQRALGALMVIFAVPTTLPMPPGVSAVVGAPLLFLSAQLMLGMRPWLPRFITERSLSRADFEKVVTAVAPWLARAESVMRPRLTMLAHRPFVHVVGLVALLMSIVLFLPIPFGNMLPSLAICIMALGVLERDGLWVLIGLATAALSVIVVWGVMWALIFGALFVLRTFVGWA